MAQAEQKYFHDRLVLLLISVSTFLALLGSLVTLLRVDGGRNEGYIVQWRSNLGISAFKTGGSSELLAFVLFSVIVLVINIVLSYRVYHLSRQFAVTVLSLGTILLTLSIIVSNALLAQR
jgi:hypothetical protein